jgi:hypothetical protein
MADAPEERLRRHEAMMAGLARSLEAPHEFNRQPLESHADVKTTLVRIETLLARMLPPGEHGREASRGKERQRMTEPNQAHDLLATLRDALHQLDGTLGLTRAGVDAIVSQVERLHANVEALCDLRQREATAVGIDMRV